MDRHFRVVLALLTLMIVTVVACTGSGPPIGDLTPDTGQPVPTEDAAPANTQSLSTSESASAVPESSSTKAVSDQPNAATDTPPSAYEGLLRAIPDTPETRGWIYIDNYTLVRKIFANDFYLPGPDDKPIRQEWYDYLPPLTNDGQFPISSFGGATFFAWAQYLPIGDLGVHPNYLAFDVRNIDQTISIGSLAGLEAIRGRFDPEATDKALASCTECPPSERRDHNGVSYYSWGDDNEKNDELKLSPPAFDKLGRGGRIAVLDDYVFRALSTGDMEALIGSHRGDRPSLADVVTFRLLANGMSQLGAYAMLLSHETFGLDETVKAVLGEGYDAAPKEQIDKLESAMAGSTPLLRAYQAFAVGAGKDDTGPYMALALVHADGKSAEDNTGRLRQRIEEGTGALYGDSWSEVLDDADINFEGRLLLAKIRGRTSLSPYDWVYHRDNLIIHE